MVGRVMMMAGGTGGHVFPALAVAQVLRDRGADVFWLGTPNSFESRVIPGKGFRLETIDIKGLRGNGLLGWLQAPWRIAMAVHQAWRVMRRSTPDLVVGMGGFVTGPGGLVARLIGTPLLIHEQNAIPGMTNRFLACIANRSLEAFPGSFPKGSGALHTGNPVRPEIAALPAPEARFAERSGPLRILVVGGSQGAQVLNQVVPEAQAILPEYLRPLIRHQAGRGKLETTRAVYDQKGVDGQISEFIDDMAEAYGWADLVICRSGALTIAELAAVGVGSILIPYPYAVDDHQTQNGRYLADKGAAYLLPQEELSGAYLGKLLESLARDRQAVLAMAIKARALALPAATKTVADECMELLGEGGVQ